MKILGIISIVIGVYINDNLFIHLLIDFFHSILYTFFVGFIGVGLALYSWKMIDEKRYHYLSIIGLVLNGFPMLSYLYLQLV